MKRCPECRRAYYDETLLYCLDDGSALLEGPASAEESATAIFPSGEDSARPQMSGTPSTSVMRKPGRSLLLGAGLLVLIVVGGLWAYRYSSGSGAVSQVPIKSLAVLPLRPLDASDNYLGMGIADAIIRRMSQTGKLIVPPTSAIKRYLNDDTDPLTAARQLNAEAVLEGSVQRDGDRLRVSVNLLRTADGVSLWNESFDMKMSDIFTVQDTVSLQVANRLSLKLDQTERLGLTKRYTSDPAAYEYYQKAIYSFSSGFDLSKGDLLAIMALLKKAVELDPNYALAHAQLAYVYARMATFVDPRNPEWAGLVNVESDIATKIDPQIAEVHLARSLILWSAYGGFQLKGAIRELLAAQQTNSNIGHGELSALYAHAGLKELSVLENKRGAELDPGNGLVWGEMINQYWLWGDYDEWAAETRRQSGKDADDPERSAWYLLGKGRLNEAQKRLEEGTSDTLRSNLMSTKAVFLALKGDFRAAENEIPDLLDKQPVEDPRYHHITFDIACVFALEAKADQAVKWLRKTAESGYPCYPRFEKDHYLDRIRQTPEFIQFMAELKSDWESYRSEFGQK